MSLTLEQVILLIAPPILVTTTYMTFKYAARRFGTQMGYLCGFLFYWIIWCLMLPLLIIGPNRLGELFTPAAAPFGNPVWLGLLLLIGPPLATFLTGFRKRIQTASLAILVASALYALANGSLEEILWRGTYVSVFPDDWFFGYLYPAIWFGLWHISPQVVYPSQMGSLPFALMAILLGLVWGFIAMTTGSILWVVVAHVLLNFAGLTGFSFLRSPNPGDRNDKPLAKR